VFYVIAAYSALSQRVGTRQYEEARRYHRELWRHTPLAGQEVAVARRAVAEFWSCQELFWRPWLMKNGEIEGFQHFTAARSAGRGVVAVFPHFGMPYALFPIMRRFGIDCWVVASPNHYEELPNPRGYLARFLRFSWGYIDLMGAGRAIPRAGAPGTLGAFDRVLGLLHDGATVSIAFDSVGSTPTPFLGRTISLASGPSKLSHETEAMVVPFVIRRRRHHPVLRFAPPLDPREFKDATALQAAIAVVMERWALELPEAVWALEDQPGGPPLIQGPVSASKSA